MAVWDKNASAITVDAILIACSPAGWYKHLATCCCCLSLSPLRRAEA